MPGLFDNIGGGGLLSGLGTVLGNVATGMDNPAALQHLRQTQQAQQATFQALLPLVGGNRDLAAAAALQPEILKQIAPELNTAPKIQNVPNAFGDPQFFATRGGMNPSVQQLPIGGIGGAPAPIAAAGTSPPGSMEEIAGRLNDMRNSGATLEEMVATLPKAYQSYLRGIVEGTGLPGSLGFKSPIRQNVNVMAQAMGLDEGQIKARMQFAHDIGNTKSGVGFRIESAKKMLNHFESLADKINKYDPKDNPGGLIGYITPDSAVQAANAISHNQPATKDIGSDIQNIAQNFAMEKGKFLSGASGGSMHERDKTVDAYNPNAPRSKLAGSLQGDMDLFKGQLAAIESQRDNLIGINTGSKRFEVVSPEMQAQMQRIQSKIDTLRRGQAGALSSRPPLSSFFK